MGSSIATTLLPTSILALHVLALLGGGGLAIAHDRATLRTARDDGARQRQHLVELRAVHRLVGAALGTSLLTGAILFFLHVERYVTSATFWIKMALIVALVVNAVVMQIAERDMSEAAEPVNGAPGAGGGVAAPWKRLRGTARISTTLWILIVVAGVTLGELR